MRVWGLALIGLLLAPPLAMAQAPSPTEFSVTVAPFLHPIEPLKETAMTNVTVRISCALAATAKPNENAVTLHLASVPSWATVSLSPSFLPIPASACTTGATNATLVARVIAKTGADAPAFTPGFLKFDATFPSTTGNETTSTQSQLTADFFSIIDVQVAEPVKVARPQTRVEIPVTLTNFGNGDTRVTFSIENASGGLQIPVPQPVTLQSKQMGGKFYQQVVPLSVFTPYRTGCLNQEGTLTLRMTSALASDPTRVGDSTQVSAVITTRGCYVPGAPLAPTLGVVALAVMVARSAHRAAPGRPPRGPASPR